jgi:hypothetical protein
MSGIQPTQSSQDVELGATSSGAGQQPVLIDRLIDALIQYSAQTTPSAGPALRAGASNAVVSGIANAVYGVVAGATSAAQTFNSVQANSDGPLLQPALPRFDQSLNTLMAAATAGKAAESIFRGVAHGLGASQGFELPPLSQDLKEALRDAARQEGRLSDDHIDQFRERMRDLNPAQALAVAQFAEEQAKSNPVNHAVSQLTSAAFNVAASKAENFYGYPVSSPELLADGERSVLKGTYHWVADAFGPQDSAKTSQVLWQARHGRDAWAPAAAQAADAQPHRPQHTSQEPTPLQSVLAVSEQVAMSFLHNAAERGSSAYLTNKPPVSVQPDQSQSAYVGSSMSSARTINIFAGVAAAPMLLASALGDLQKHQIGMVPKTRENADRSGVSNAMHGALHALEHFVALGSARLVAVGGRDAMINALPGTYPGSDFRPSVFPGAIAPYMAGEVDAVLMESVMERVTEPAKEFLKGHDTTKLLNAVREAVDQLSRPPNQADDPQRHSDAAQAPEASVENVRAAIDGINQQSAAARASATELHQIANDAPPLVQRAEALAEKAARIAGLSDPVQLQQVRDKLSSPQANEVKPAHRDAVHARDAVQAARELLPQLEQAAQDAERAAGEAEAVPQRLAETFSGQAEAAANGTEALRDQVGQAPKAAQAAELAAQADERANAAQQAADKARVAAGIPAPDPANPSVSIQVDQPTSAQQSAQAAAQHALRSRDAADQARDVAVGALLNEVQQTVDQLPRPLHQADDAQRHGDAAQRHSDAAQAPDASMEAVRAAIDGINQQAAAARASATELRQAANDAPLLLDSAEALARNAATLAGLSDPAELQQVRDKLNSPQANEVKPAQRDAVNALDAVQAARELLPQLEQAAQDAERAAGEAEAVPQRLAETFSGQAEAAANGTEALRDQVGQAPKAAQAAELAAQADERANAAQQAADKARVAAGIPAPDPANPSVSIQVDQPTSAQQSAQAAAQHALRSRDAADQARDVAVGALLNEVQQTVDQLPRPLHQADDAQRHGDAAQRHSDAAQAPDASMEAVRAAIDGINQQAAAARASATELRQAANDAPLLLDSAEALARNAATLAGLSDPAELQQVRDKLNSPQANEVKPAQRDAVNALDAVQAARETLPPLQQAAEGAERAADQAEAVPQRLAETFSGRAEAAANGTESLRDQISRAPNAAQAAALATQAEQHADVAQLAANRARAAAGLPDADPANPNVSVQIDQPNPAQPNAQTAQKHAQRARDAADEARHVAAIAVAPADRAEATADDTPTGRAPQLSGDAATAPASPRDPLQFGGLPYQRNPLSFQLTQRDGSTFDADSLNAAALGSGIALRVDGSDQQATVVSVTDSQGQEHRALEVPHLGFAKLLDAQGRKIDDGMLSQRGDGSWQTNGARGGAPGSDDGQSQGQGSEAGPSRAAQGADSSAASQRPQQQPGEPGRSEITGLTAEQAQVHADRAARQADELAQQTLGDVGSIRQSIESGNVDNRAGLHADDAAAAAQSAADAAAPAQRAEDTSAAPSTTVEQSRVAPHINIEFDSARDPGFADKVDAALQRIADGGPNGYKLVHDPAAMVAEGKQITIKSDAENYATPVVTERQRQKYGVAEDDDGKGIATDKSQRGLFGNKGKGASVDIGFNPDRSLALGEQGQPVGRSDSGEDNFLTLAHELAHARRILKGELTRGSRAFLSPEDRQNRAERNEEARAVGLGRHRGKPSENTVRAEYDRSARQFYADPATGKDYQTKPGYAFGDAPANLPDLPEPSTPSERSNRGQPDASLLGAREPDAYAPATDADVPPPYTEVPPQPRDVDAPPPQDKDRGADPAQPRVGSTDHPRALGSQPGAGERDAPSDGSGGDMFDRVGGTDNLERIVDGDEVNKKNPDAVTDEFVGARDQFGNQEVAGKGQAGAGAKGQSGATRSDDGGHTVSASGQAGAGAGVSVQDKTGPLKGQGEVFVGGRAEGRAAGHVGPTEVEGTAEGRVSVVNTSGSATVGSEGNNVTVGGGANAGASGIVSGGVSDQGASAVVDAHAGVEIETTTSTELGDGAVKTQATGGLDLGAGVGVKLNAGMDDGVLTFGIGGRLVLGIGGHFDLSIKIDFNKIKDFFTGHVENPFKKIADGLNERNGGRTQYSGAQLEFFSRAYVKDKPEDMTYEQLLQKMADDGLLQQAPNGDVTLGATPTTDRGRHALAMSMLSTGNGAGERPEDETSKAAGEGGSRPGKGTNNEADKSAPSGDGALDDTKPIDAKGLAKALNYANRGDSETEAKGQALINLYGDGKTIDEDGLQRAMKDGSLAFGELESVHEGKKETIQGYRFQPDLKKMSKDNVFKMLSSAAADGKSLADTINNMNAKYFGSKNEYVGEAQGDFAVKAYTADGTPQDQAVKDMLDDGVLLVNKEGQLDLNLKTLWDKAKSKDPKEAQRAKDLIAQGIIRSGGGPEASSVDSKDFAKGMNRANRGDVDYAGAEGMANLYGKGGKVDAKAIGSMIDDGTLSHGDVTTTFNGKKEKASGIQMNMDLTRVGGGRISDMLVKGKDDDGAVDGKELAKALNDTNARFIDNKTEFVGDQQAEFVARGYAADGKVDKAAIDRMIADGVIAKDAGGGLTINAFAYQHMIDSDDPKRKDEGAGRLADSLLFSGGGEKAKTLNIKQLRASLDKANRGEGDYGPDLDRAFKLYAGADGKVDRNDLEKMALDGVIGAGDLKTTFGGKKEDTKGLVVKMPSQAGLDSKTLAGKIADNSGKDGVDAKALQDWLPPGQNIDQLNVLMRGYDRDGRISEQQLQSMIDDGVLQTDDKGQLKVDTSVVFDKAHSADRAEASHFQELLTNMLGAYGKDSRDTKSDYAAKVHGEDVPERITGGKEFARALNDLAGKTVVDSKQVPDIVESFTQANAKDHTNLRENNVRHAVASGAVAFDQKTGAVSVNTDAFA